MCTRVVVGTLSALMHLDTTTGRLELHLSERSPTENQTVPHLMPPNSSSAAESQWSTAFLLITLRTFLLLLRLLTLSCRRSIICGQLRL